MPDSIDRKFPCAIGSKARSAHWETGWTFEPTDASDISIDLFVQFVGDGCLLDKARE